MEGEWCPRRRSTPALLLLLWLLVFDGISTGFIICGVDVAALSNAMLCADFSSSSSLVSLSMAVSCSAMVVCMALLNSASAKMFPWS